MSLPATDCAAVRDFWEALGWVAAEEEHPFPHVSLRSDGLDLGLHRPRFSAEPLLVFCDRDMPERIAGLRELGVGPLQPPPRGLDAKANAVLTAPEGTALLLLRDAVAP